MKFQVDSSFAQLSQNDNTLFHYLFICAFWPHYYTYSLLYNKKRCSSSAVNKYKFNGLSLKIE